MKRAILVLGILFIGAAGYSDEIMNEKGKLFDCKVETVASGLVEYTRGGNLYSFTRVIGEDVFSDYVDVRTSMRHPSVVERIYGNIIYRDNFSLKMNTRNGAMVIPWYRNAFVGIYKPNMI